MDARNSCRVVLDEPAVWIAWLTCECGKMHTTAMIGPMTECTCGRRLWQMIWAANHRTDCR